MAGIVAGKIVQMFIILIAGYIAFKTNLIDAAATRKLSNLLLMLVAPLLIFNSYQMDFDLRLFYGLLWTLAASAISFAVCIFAARLIFRGEDPHRAVEKLAVAYSNCGYIGIPLANGILGAQGVFYMTAYVTVYNIFFWTHGVMLMGSSNGFRGLWRKLVNPTLIAVFAGIVFFVTGLRLPEFLATPLQQLGSMNTPLAMIIAGANLAQGNLLETLKKRRLYSISLVKLVVFPLITLAIVLLLPIDFNVAFTVFVGSACPVGAGVIMFAERYEKDAHYAAELFMVTTVLSALTIPLMSLPAIRLLG